MHVNEGRNFLEIEKQKGFEFQKLKVKEVYERWFERKKIQNLDWNCGVKKGPRVFSKQLWYGLEKKEINLKPGGGGKW